MRRIALVVAALLLAACGGWEGTGVVVGRDFVPAHTETTLMPQYITVCSGSGANFRCTQQLTGYTPITDHVEDAWSLVVQDAKGDTHRVAVDEAMFNATPNGATFTAGGDR